MVTDMNAEAEMTGSNLAAHLDKAMHVARIEIASRAARAAYFAPDRIEDAAWSMLLFMFLEQHRDLKIGDVCDAALSPRTTCLRHIENLSSMGWIELRDDRKDRRVRRAQLSQRGLTVIRSYLDSTGALTRLVDERATG